MGSGHGRLDDHRIAELAGRLDGSLRSGDEPLRDDRQSVGLEEPARLLRSQPPPAGTDGLAYDGLGFVVVALELG